MDTVVGNPSVPVSFSAALALSASNASLALSLSERATLRNLLSRTFRTSRKPQARAAAANSGQASSRPPPSPAIPATPCSRP